MASVPLFSLCLPHGKLSPLSFSYRISDNLRSASASVGFSSIKKNRGFRVSVCRAAAVVFRDLDADDFRHPLDKQLSELHQLMTEAAEILNLEAPDLYAVLAHELGHLKCDHGVWLTFANILTLGAYTVPGRTWQVDSSELGEQLFRWLRAAELTCDRAALLVAQTPRNAQTRQLSHPLPVLRAREIDEWSRSQEYRTLLKRAIQMNAVQNV
ncbi:hypothetical protein GH714_041762 [Hevea brasiliensis]|uniref:Peptidase M48 domain-containing protein n=1 Tax=Hevea brasiliensis TaxID=3981 RepID=A0A6A6MRJ4_HEVBR|nr:hypothetical protein GH714_041762 [Hevea brasiliensis]